MKKDAIIAACQTAILTGQRVKLDCPASIYQVIKSRLRNHAGRMVMDSVDLVVDRVANCIWVDPVVSKQTIPGAALATQPSIGGDLDSVVRDFYIQAVNDGYFQTGEPINRKRARLCLRLWNLQNVTDVTIHNVAGQTAFYRKSCGRALKRCRRDWANKMRKI